MMERPKDPLQAFVLVRSGRFRLHGFNLSERDLPLPLEKGQFLFGSDSSHRVRIIKYPGRINIHLATDPSFTRGAYASPLPVRSSYPSSERVDQRDLFRWTRTDHEPRRSKFEVPSWHGVLGAGREGHNCFRIGAVVRRSSSPPGSGGLSFYITPSRKR